MEIHQLRAGQHPGTGILQCFVTTKNPSVPTSCGLFRADYIKANNLQNPENKREILADEKLRAVFGGKNKVSMFEMNKHFAQHLS
jgi:hypothetical protein